MDTLADHDLYLYCGTSDREGEQRITMRTISDQAFVAWFQCDTRLSGEELKTGINIQFVHRHELTPEQVKLAKDWLREKANEMI